ncbi:MULTISPECIES: type VI secretion system protein [unclassified Variovorax]|uniref:type VI secretion system protein n=1 Tax=unclassified Variovorax TaxID=663243 RepID=UPI0008B2B7A6|nr:MULTISPECIES: type VI secretion system protein [unclassified Variovorax]SEK16625.1 ImcF-related N-terminal domain-containing protein [Variovorax sp. OK202]SFD11535.1 type VI secretion system protein ImpL [Variovorax sp. OK212]
MTALLSPAHRFWLLLSLCVLGFGLLYAVVRDAGCGARRRGLVRRIAAMGAPPAEADQAAVDALRDGMSQAQQTLRRTLRSKSAALVPWFLFFGGTQARVPALLATARGERAPAGDDAGAHAAASGDPFGGAWWHWWLTGAAMAVETHPGLAGDTGGTPAMRGLWLQSLLALAERRNRLPLNGLVVCVGAHELLHDDATELRPKAARLRHLLDETSDTLRLQLPTYLVVTGLEQLAGYAVLRGALAPEVLAQAIGHRLTDPSAFIETPAGARFDAVFEPIVQQLHGLRMALLREQPSAAARLAVHSFVEDVRALQPGLRQFAEVLFESHGKGTRMPRWRGLYLTASASQAHADDAADSGGAFVSDLFGHFLPADQPLVRPGRPSSATSSAPSTQLAPL